EIYLLEKRKNLNALTEPVLISKRQDLGIRTLRYKDQAHTTLISMDSLLSIAPNSDAGFIFEYRTSTGKEPNTQQWQFKIHPDSAKDYLASKIQLNVEFYNANSQNKADTLSAYVFSRVL